MKVCHFLHRNVDRKLNQLLTLANHQHGNPQILMGNLVAIISTVKQDFADNVFKYIFNYHYILDDKNNHINFGNVLCTHAWIDTLPSLSKRNKRNFNIFTNVLQSWKTHMPQNVYMHVGMKYINGKDPKYANSYTTYFTQISYTDILQCIARFLKITNITFSRRANSSDNNSKINILKHAYRLARFHLTRRAYKTMRLASNHPNNVVSDLSPSYYKNGKLYDLASDEIVKKLLHKTKLSTHAPLYTISAVDFTHHNYDKYQPASVKTLRICINHLQAVIRNKFCTTKKCHRLTLWEFKAIKKLTHKTKHMKTPEAIKTISKWCLRYMPFFYFFVHNALVSSTNVSLVPQIPTTAHNKNKKVVDEFVEYLSENHFICYKAYDSLYWYLRDLQNDYNYNLTLPLKEKFLKANNLVIDTKRTYKHGQYTLHTTLRLPNKSDVKLMLKQLKTICLLPSDVNDLYYLWFKDIMYNSPVLALSVKKQITDILHEHNSHNLIHVTVQHDFYKVNQYYIKAQTDDESSKPWNLKDIKSTNNLRLLILDLLDVSNLNVLNV